MMMDTGVVHLSRASSAKSWRSRKSGDIEQRPITSVDRHIPPPSPNDDDRLSAFMTEVRARNGFKTQVDSSESESDSDGEELRLRLKRISKSAPITPYDLNLDEENELDYETDLEIEIVSEPKITELTGVTLYERLCQEYGVVPLSCIRSNIDKTHFNMSHRGIGEVGVKAMAPPISMSAFAKSLNLTNNMIGPSGCEFISYIIHTNEFITELFIAYNQLKGEGLMVLAPAIRESSSLTTVDISSNEFEDRDAPLIADIIENNISLRSLNLSRNQFSIEAGKIFGTAIANNDTLETLDLSWNAIRLEGAQAFAKGIATNLGLKTLNLSMNGFGVDGTRSIGIALTLNKYLEHLDLSFNRVSNAAAADFARYFKINTTLKTIKLSGNPIMYDGAQEILKTIAANERSSIYNLNLEGLQVHQEFVDLVQSMNAEKPFAAQYGVVSHGKNIEGKIDRFADKNPLEILLIFMGEMNLRLVDLFRSFDKDQSGGLTRDEFIVGLQEIKTPLSRSQLDELLDMLDKDGDGEIDLKEILNINREFREIKMKANRFVQEEKLQKKLEKEGKKETELGAFTKEAMAMKQRAATFAGAATDAAAATGTNREEGAASAPPPTEALTAGESSGSGEQKPAEPAATAAPDPRFQVTSEEAEELNKQVSAIKTKGVMNMWKKKALV